MKFNIITIFPNQITDFLKEGIFRIACEKGIVEIIVHNLRDWATDKHKTVDDRPFGGGAGMLIKPEPVFAAVQELQNDKTTVIAMTPSGIRLQQNVLQNFAVEEDHEYIVLCGHYEGFDQRILDELVDIEVSVGDYVLSGGELPALILVDGIIRLIPGVLGNAESLSSESFNENTLDFPQYTRPYNFNGLKVPEILISGHHKEIEKWRQSSAKALTDKKRKDLIG